MEKLLKPERFEGSLDTTPAQWTHWLCTFTNFVQSIEGSPDKLKLLVNYVSPEAYSHISDCRTYEEAISALKKVYVKPKNIIFARHKLATRRQQPGETVDDYLLSLKLLAKECDFKDVTADVYSQESIRDSFISGLSSSVIRQRLLEKETMTLNDAALLARSLDAAQRNAEGYAPPSATGGLCAGATAVAAATDTKNAKEPCCAATRGSSAPPSLPGACYFCGGKRHARDQCPARDSVCHFCSIRGHFASVCKARHSRRPRKPRVSSAAAAVEARGSSAGYSSALCGHCAPPTGDASASPVSASAITPSCSTIPVSVNNLQVKSLIDSGSSISFIHQEVAERLNVKIHPSRTNITLASSQVSTTLGHCFVNLKVNENLYNNFKVSVLPKLCSQVILGQDFMEKHKSVEFYLSGSLPKLTVCGVACMSIDPPSLFPNLSKDTKPISTPSRSFSTSDSEFIHEEVASLLRDGIIEKSQSPWKAQVLVTKDDRHKRRMVVDYSRTINRFTLLDAYPMPRIHDLVHKIAKYKVFSKIDLKSAYYQIPLRDSEKQYTAFEADGQLFHFSRVPFGLTNSVAVFQRAMDTIIADNNLQATYAYIDDVIICGKDDKDHDLKLQRFKEVASKYNLTLNIKKCHYHLNSITYLGYSISNGFFCVLTLIELNLC